ncbi:MAG: hypothetical protein GF410_16200 [Chitinivibrionales bacterium]|nr:hypothetical protein [Chitinivibrionales bacterium]
MKQVVLYTTVAALLANAGAREIECPRGSHVLFYYPDRHIDQTIQQDFSNELREELKEPLAEMGYCLYQPPDIEQYRTDTSYAENLVLHTAVRAREGSRLLLVALIRTGRLGGGNLETALGRPLVEVEFGDVEPGTFRAVAAKKIVENLRTSYVCHLRVESEPDSVYVATKSGLEGVTPIEWIVPLGRVDLTATREDHMPFEKRLVLDSAGYHKVYMELRPRRFYHSRFMYPTLACLVAGGAFYALERYYYDRYQSLGEDDYYNRPGEFGERFDRAKTFERLAGASLGLAAVSLTLSFWF